MDWLLKRDLALPGSGGKRVDSEDGSDRVHYKPCTGKAESSRGNSTDRCQRPGGPVSQGCAISIKSSGGPRGDTQKEIFAGPDPGYVLFPARISHTSES